MKLLLVFVVLLLGLLPRVLAQNTDLPGPTANLQTLPANSYIIAMDNTNQLNSSALFNIKTYGLIVYLLNNNIKVKWVIKAGKIKNGIDFTVSSDQIKPSLNLTSVSRDFKAGPFVIFAPDTTGVGALIDDYYTSSSLTGSNQPNIYRSTVAATVDVRYDMTGFKPTAAVLTDGGNQALQLAYMSKAGIPAANYTTSSGQTLLSHCYTFASEPHNANTGTSVDNAIRNIRIFVLSGGNFLGQCAAISNYENNPLGRFQTTTGINVSNSSIGTTVLYANADLSYSQFDGLFSGSLIASTVQNWKIAAATINSEHNHVTGQGAKSNIIAASVSKLASGEGSLVFYLGNHDYTTTSEPNINGIRMYMNAFLTPAYQVCPIVLALTLGNFDGSLQNGKSQLQWTAIQNQDFDHFNVEKSTDNGTFSIIGRVSTTPAMDIQSYTFTEPEVLNGTAYYRLGIVGKNDNTTYSKTISLTNNQQATTGKITLQTNPIHSVLSLNYTAPGNAANEINIYNTNGVRVFEEHISAQKGPNLISLTLNNEIPSGVYLLEIINNLERITTKFIKQ